MSYVSVCQHSEVIPLDVQKRQDEETPPILQDKPDPFLESILVDGIASINEVEQHIIEQSLEGRDASALNVK